MLDLETLNWERGDGLVVVIAQHAVTGDVLMVAHADRDALARTIETGDMHYRSRSRGLWHKGATSGHTQRVISLAPDCDGDAVLARVLPAGPACHTGRASCFGPETGDVLTALDQVIAQRLELGTAREEPRIGAGGDASAAERSGYTRRLGTDRNLRLKKLGEETAELVTALADGERARVVEEAADLIYHVLVALRAAGASLDDVRAELARRARC
ncbi:MAG TPA: bifunctional phosphoribosyl-AMP cyclohydrolase/phosphoribosyl-ATP diphosphatase HisIE [Gemmatimonadaceae bacterium]|nr:bifunctional phosphoribosyl-AMP cyclohydrolase/phosphoribosyl-ATP diphosphatase HisIE [Gemmatimonadaceae bacterium]